MSYLSKRRDNVPRACDRCNEPALPGKTYCEAHSKTRVYNPPRVRPPLRKPYKSKRPKHPLKDSKEWREFARAYLAEHPWCARCELTESRPVPAVHVDHVRPLSVSPELAFDLLNLQPLCRKCHGSKSNHDMRGIHYDYVRKREYHSNVAA